MAVNKERFERVAGTARYFDRETGQTVSYRRAITESIGMTPEQLAALRRELGVTRERTRREWIRNELHKKGERVRGPGAERTRATLDALDEIMPLDTDDPSGGNWLGYLYDEYGDDFWEATEWDDFFYPEGE